MTASLVFDSTDTDSGTLGPSGTFTFALTVASASGAERVVLVAGTGVPAATCDFVSCTIDGQAGTRLGTTSRGPDDGGGAAAFVTAYRATGTASTSINVVVTYLGSGTCFGGACACYKLSGADTVLATTSTAVNDPTLSANTASGGAALATVYGYQDAGGPTLVWTGLTERYDSVRVFSGDVFSGASADIVTGETPRAISAAITPDLNGGGDSVAGIAITFNATAAAAGTTTAEKESAWRAAGTHLTYTTRRSLHIAYGVQTGFPLVT